MWKNVWIKILIWYKTGEMLKNWVEQGFIFHVYHYFCTLSPSCAPPPPFLLGVGWTSYQIFKKGALTGSQFLEKGCWGWTVCRFKEWCFFRGRGQIPQCPLWYLLVKMLLARLNNLHTSASLNLNYGTTKQKTKMWRLQEWWNLKFLTSMFSVP